MEAYNQLNQEICNVDAEQSLLGAIILNNNYLITVQDILKPEHFHYTTHQKIYSHIIFCVEKNNIVADRITLKQLFETDPDIKNDGGVKYLSVLLSGASSFGIRDYADIIIDCWKRRELKNYIQKILEKISIPSNSFHDLSSELSQKIENLDIDEQTQPRPIANVVAEKLWDMANKKNDEIVSTGFIGLDDKTGGFNKGYLVIIAGRPSMGKAQPLDSKILLKKGWVNMGNIQIGDELASIDGEESKVIGIYPQGIKQIYKVNFRDGRNVECCGEHLWRVYYKGESRIVETNRLLEMLNCKRYKNRLWVDNFDGDFGLNDNLEIDPWALGALIGDGGFTSQTISFSNSNKQIVDKLVQRLGGQAELKLKSRKNNVDYRLNKAKMLKDKLKNLGLLGCYSYEKFIPKEYLKSNKENRLELLRGLLDTDGFVENTGTIRYCTSSEKLANDVVYLANSLGATTYLKSKKAFFVYKGMKKEGRKHYRITISHPSDVDFLTCDNKKDKIKIIKKIIKRNTIKSVDRIGLKQAQCIKVSHPSKLYITDNFIATHNTTFSLCLAKEIAKNDHVLYISIEMTSKQIISKIIGNEASINLKKIKLNHLDKSELETACNAGERIGELKFNIDYPTKGITIRSLKAKIKRQVEKFKTKVVFIDHLGKIKSEGKTWSKNEEVSQITNSLKDIANELGIVIVVLSQLSRAVEQRQDKRPQLSDLRDSGSIEQDADIVMFCFRAEYYLERCMPSKVYEPNDYAEWERELSKVRGLCEIIIAKAREGEPQTARFNFNGSYGRFTEIQEQNDSY